MKHIITADVPSLKYVKHIIISKKDLSEQVRQLSSFAARLFSLFQHVDPSWQMDSSSAQPRTWRSVVEHHLTQL